MAKYRKKPVVIEAVRWTGTMDNQREVADFMDMMTFELKDDSVYIPTLEGTMLANPGDYIIKGIQGEFYPCKPDIFKATYEEA